MIWPRKHHNRQAERGNLALITGLAAIPLSVIVVIVVEMAALANEKALMQAAVDSAALAGARELSIAGSSARNPSEFAANFAFEQVAELSPRIRMRFSARQNPNGTFEVIGDGVRGSFFGNLVPPGGFVINVRAIAETLNQQPMCVLAMPKMNGDLLRGLRAQSNSNIVANNCLVHANGNIVTAGAARIVAGTIQATQTASGTGYSPTANSGALAIGDPFSSRRIEREDACENSEADKTYSGTTTATLTAGVHEGGITVTGNARLVLAPGEHYFCEDLVLSGSGILTGDNVVLIFDDDSLQATGNSQISLTGRTTGDWAGFLMVATRDTDDTMLISSAFVDKLLGTIYLPNAPLVVNATGTVAEDSKWSVIVARRIEMDRNARLVINTDYAGSGVPVPMGVGNNLPNNSPTRLRQ